MGGVCVCEIRKLID